MKYPVVEIFTSIQGEGLAAGRPSCFVRLYGCNLRCVHCDTVYSWSGGVYEVLDVNEISSRLGAPRLVTITGGEPLLHDLVPLVKALLEDGREVLVETNGSLEPPKELLVLGVEFAVSPKLKWQYPGYTLRFPIERASCFKFVARSVDDLEEVMLFLRENGIDPWKVPVYVQPDGRLPDEEYLALCRRLWEAVSSKYWCLRFLPQLHRMVWGRKRGV